MSNPVIDAKASLSALLNNDVIQVRPSDRETFMNDWRSAMGNLDKAVQMIDLPSFDPKEKLPDPEVDGDFCGQIWALFDSGLRLVSVTDFLAKTDEAKDTPIAWAHTGLEPPASLVH